MAYITSSDGQRIHYIVEGEGELCLIFIHGAGGFIANWKYQKIMALTYKLVFIDLPGHGESGIDRVQYTMELFGKDVVALVEKLGLDKIILIGHSMGGAVILEAAKILGTKVLGIIGVDTLFPHILYIESAETPLLERWQENFSHFVEDLKALIIEKAHNDDIIEVVSRCQEMDKRSLFSELAELYKWDFRNVLDEIQQPIRCIVAGKTLPTPDLRKEYNKYFQTVYIENVGHLLMYEEPDKLTKLLELQIQSILKN